MEEKFSVDQNGQWSLLEKARRPEDDARDARTKAMIEQFMAEKAKREAPRAVPPPAATQYPEGMRPVSQERMSSMNHRPLDSRNMPSDADKMAARMQAEKRFREEDAKNIIERKNITQEVNESQNRALPRSAKLVPVAGKNTTLSSRSGDDVAPLAGASFYPRAETEASQDPKSKPKDSMEYSPLAQRIAAEQKATAPTSGSASAPAAPAESKPATQRRVVMPNATPQAKSGPVVERRPSLGQPSSTPIAPRKGEFQLPRSLDQAQTDRHDRSNLGGKKYTVEGLPPPREGMYHGEAFSTKGKIVQKPLFFHNKETDERGRKMVDQQEMHDWSWDGNTKEWKYTGSRLTTPK